MRFTHTALVAAILGASPAAFAQPGVTPPATPSVPVTDLASRGITATNLRLDLRCADYWVTPARGAVVTVDGVPAAPAGIEGQNVLVEGRHGPYTSWVPTDVMYGAPLGAHRIQVDAPGCASFAQDLTIGMMPLAVDGRLAISDDALRGTAAAPNGLGFVLGGAMRPIGARTGAASLGDEHSEFASNSATEYGLQFATTFDRRHLAMGLDMDITWGTGSGTLHETAGDPVVGTQPGAMPYTESLVDARSAYRIGYRLPLHNFALAAGAGVGFDLRDDHQKGGPGADPFAYFPDQTNGSLFVPVWASATYKPTCGMGVQVTGSYDVEVAGSVGSMPLLTAGLLWQPNAACLEAPGVTIR